MEYGIMVTAAIWSVMVLYLRVHGEPVSSESETRLIWRYLRPGVWPVEVRALVIDYVREHCTIEDIERRLPGNLRSVAPFLPEHPELVDYLRVLPVSITEAFLGDWLVYAGVRLTRTSRPARDELILRGMSV